MDRQIFIDLYKKRISELMPEFRKDSWVNDNEIGCVFLKEKVTIPIDTCLKVIDFFKKAHTYIKGLKPGDALTTYAYGSINIGVIKKINYKRKLNKKGERIISSLITDTGYFPIKKRDIMYQGNVFQDIIDAYLHVNYYTSFSEYDVNNINKILTERRP